MIRRAPLRARTRKWLRKMAAEGTIILGTGNKPLGLKKPIRTRGKPLSQMIIEDRR